MANVPEFRMPNQIENIWNEVLCVSVRSLMRFLRNNRFALASMDGKTWRQSKPWFSKLIFLEKPVFADIPYWISASFHVRPWLFLMWAFRLLILALLEPHTGQQNGFSPVCILMCMISFCFEMNFLLHWSHWCSQDSCLKRVICENKNKQSWFDYIISIGLNCTHPRCVFSQR